jgi:hypothetical protein
MIGKVLGHRQARTTEGNARLAADRSRFAGPDGCPNCCHYEEVV